MSFLDNLSPEQKKQYVMGGVAAGCLVLAVVMYVVLSSGGGSNPAVAEAEAKARALNEQMAAQEPKIPDPPAPTAKSRSAVRSTGE